MNTDIKTLTPGPPGKAALFREAIVQTIVNLINDEGWKVARKCLTTFSKYLLEQEEWPQIHQVCRTLINKARQQALQHKHEQQNHEEHERQGNQYFYITAPTDTKIGYVSQEQLENHFHDTVNTVAINPKKQ